MASVLIAPYLDFKYYGHVYLAYHYQWLVWEPGTPVSIVSRSPSSPSLSVSVSTNVLNHSRIHDESERIARRFNWMGSYTDGLRLMVILFLSLFFALPFILSKRPRSYRPPSLV